ITFLQAALTAVEITVAELPLKPSASAHFPASSATESATPGLDGRMIEIGLLFFEAKKRTRPVGSTARTAPQRGHLNLPADGTSSVTRQRAHGVCSGNETGGAGGGADDG